MNAKKLAMIQVIIFIILLVVAIVASADKGLSDGFFWNNMGNVLGILFLILFIAGLVVAIMQIIAGATGQGGLSIAAGICGILSFIWIVAIAALIMNIVVWVRGR